MYTHTMTGLTANQIDELLEIFGNNCHGWDKAQGHALVEFETEEDFYSWRQGFEFEEE